MPDMINKSRPSVISAKLLFWRRYGRTSHRHARFPSSTSTPPPPHPHPPPAPPVLISFTRTVPPSLHFGILYLSICLFFLSFSHFRGCHPERARLRSLPTAPPPPPPPAGGSHYVYFTPNIRPILREGGGGGGGRGYKINWIYRTRGARTSKRNSCLALVFPQA